MCSDDNLREKIFDIFLSVNRKNYEHIFYRERDEYFINIQSINFEAHRGKGMRITCQISLYLI